MSIIRSSAIMSMGTAVSRALGFVRALILTAILGSMSAANAFDVANKVPNLLYMVIAGGILNAVLVPQIVASTKHKDGGELYLNRLVTLALVMMAGLTVLLTLAGPILIRLFGTDRWNDGTFQLAVVFAYICVPQVFFYGLYTVLGQILNARNSFGPYMWAPVVNNVVAIAGMVVFLVVYGRGDSAAHEFLPQDWTPGMIWLLAGTSTLGVLCQAVVLIPYLRKIGFRYRFDMRLRGVGLGSAARVAGWTFAAVIAGQLVFMTTSKVAALASALAENVSRTEVERTASNAVYSLGFLLFMLPHSIVVVSLVTALFTRMSSNVQEGDTDAVRSDVSMALRVVVLIAALSTAGLVALQGPIGSIMTANPNTAPAIGAVTAAMALGLVPFSANYLLQRVSYAYQDGRLPFMAQLPNLAVMLIANVLSYLYLPHRWIVVGIALGMSAGHLVGLVTNWVVLSRRLGGLDEAHVLGVWGRAGAAAVVVGALGWFGADWLASMVPATQSGAAVNAAVVGTVMVCVYLLLLHMLRVHEVRLMTRLIRRRR